MDNMIFTSEVCGVVLIAPFDKISRPPCSTIRFIVFLSLFFRCFSPFSLYHRTFSLTVEIRRVETNKKQYLALLLLADEQEDMIDRYLERGSMYVLEDDGVKAECVVTDEGGGVLELKNIAVEPDFQGKGYGKALVDFLIRAYAGQYTLLQVGTGDSPSTIPFYESCGFCRHHLVKNFFTDHYDHPIYECGVKLVDMVYLQREL